MGLFNYWNYKSSTVRNTSYNDKDTSPIMGLISFVGLASLVPLLLAVIVTVGQSYPGIAIIIGVFLGCRWIDGR